MGIKGSKSKLIQGTVYMSIAILLAVLIGTQITSYSINHPYKKRISQTEKNVSIEGQNEEKISDIDNRFKSIFNPQSETRLRRLEIWNAES